MSRQFSIANSLARSLSWVVAAIFFLLPFHALLTTWLGSSFGYIDLFRIWKELAIFVIFPLVLTLSLAQPALRRRFWRDHLVWLCAAYAFIFIICGLVAIGRDQVNAPALIYSWLSNLRFIGFMLIIMAISLVDDFLQRHWLKLLLGPALIVVLFGLLQHFVLRPDFLRHFGYGPGTIPATQTVDQKSEYLRLQSTLRGANPLGAYLVLVITAALSQLWRRRLRTLISGLLLSGLLVLGFTYSRSAWLALPLSAGLLLGWQYPSPKARRYLAVGVAVVLVGLAGSLAVTHNNRVLQNTFFHTDSTSASPQSSNASRLAALKAAAQETLHEPLGRGPGTAGPASFRNNHPARIAEDYFLQIAQEVGWLGLTLFLAINAIVVRRLWQQRSSLLSQVLLASWVGLTLINFVSHAWADDTLGLLWWGLAGLALAQPVILNKKRKQYAN